jgi:hypothetical protein
MTESRIKPGERLMKKSSILIILTITLLFSACKSQDEVIRTQEEDWLVKVRQNGDTYLIEGETALVPLARAPFQIIFPAKSYSPETGEPYAVRILVTENVLQFNRFGNGTSLADFPGLRPGTGMACAADEPYPQMTISDTGHHYIIYDPNDPHSRRAVLMEQRGNDLLLSWTVRYIRYPDGEYPVRAMPARGFTMIIVFDANLNGIADPGEWYKAEMRFTE